EAERRDDEALPGARRQPAGRPDRMPPARGPAAGALRAVLRVPPAPGRRPALPVRAEPPRDPQPDSSDRGHADPRPRLPGLPAARGRDHLRADEDAPAAAPGEPDRPGAADAADPADDGFPVAGDDRLLRAVGPGGPVPLLVHRELRQYHSAEFRGRV